MIGARNLKRTDAVSHGPISCYNHYISDSFTNVTVKNNICQGSLGSGFIIPFATCGSLNTNTGFSMNTAGSCKLGFVINQNSNGNDCKESGYLKAYGCDVGITSNPYASSVTWTGLMLADNTRALGLRFGYGQTNSINNLFLKNSWISAISRPECDVCYGD